MEQAEVYNSHPKNLNYTIPIDFKSVQELPESHTWCKPSSCSNEPAAPNSHANLPIVPVIDMKDPKAIQLMKKACEEWGMFQIINHGIEMELFQQVEDQTRELFALPFEQKLQALRSTNAITGYGVAKISPFFTKLMWSEGFTIVGSSLEFALSLWPQECATRSTFCNVINKYQEALKELSQKILSMMVTSLGLSYDDVEWFKPNTGSTCTQPVLQLNSYPTCPSPDQAMGLAAHTDSSLITLLYQSNTSGLQVFQENVGWINVEPITGGLVVNTGDLFQILSNGIFKSSLHQALVNQAQHRISVAYFLGPPNDVEVSPVMRLVEPGQLPLYRRITWKEYITLKGAYFCKALDHIRSDPTKAEDSISID